jgi:hypothetical protein
MPKRKRILESASFHEGDIVTVYNQTLAGKPIIEGQAAIVGPGDVEDQYRVRFRDKRTGKLERQAYLRFVYPGGSQDDPRGYLAAVIHDYLKQS